MKIKQVKVSALKESPIRHTTLPQEAIARIKSFKEILAGVDNISLEDTITNFQRDMNPEREISIWEHIASTYRAFVAENFITGLDTRKEVYHAALIASMGMNDFSKIKLLNKGQIDKIIYNFNSLSISYND